MRRKYGNKKVTYGDRTFDSQREAKRYRELHLLERAGEIRDLQCQVKFVLIPAQYEEYERTGKNGRPLRPGTRCVEKECSYVADFVYWQGDHLVVEDSKGFRTKDYIIKRKLMRLIYGIAITEV